MGVKARIVPEAATAEPVARDRREAGRGAIRAASQMERGLPAALVVLLAAVLIVGALQVERPIVLPIGGPHETPFVRNFHPRARTTDDRTRYRWTDATSFVVFPGIGGGRERRLTLRMRSGRPTGSMQPVIVLVNGAEIGRTEVGESWQTVALAVRGPATAAHGVAVELRTPTDVVPAGDGQRVGVQVAELTLATLPGGMTMPAWGTFVQALVAVLLVYLMAVRGFALIERRGPRWQWYAAFIGAASGSVVAALFVVAPAYIAVSLPLLVVVLAGAFLLLLLPRPLQWLGMRLHLATTDREAAALCGILALTAIAKLGGLLYPDTQVIDLAWHVRWERTLLHGDFAALYFPSALSSGPGVWGEGILIPKSPLYYLAMAPFSLLPFSLGTILKLLAGGMELVPPLVAYAVLKRIGMGKAGVVAALLYAVTPLSYLILSYGSYPTLFAQFLSLLTFAVVLFAGERLGRPSAFTLFAVVLTLSLLAYPVVAIFTACVLGATGWWWWCATRDREARRRALLLPLGVLIASAVAFAVYYAQYVRIVLGSVHTLTGQTAANRGYLDGGLRGIPWHVASVVAHNVDVGHLYLLLPLAIAGVVLMYRCRTSETTPTSRLLCVWLLVMPAFTLVDAYIDLLLKPLFYTMVPVAIFAGVAVGGLWDRGKMGRVLAVCCCAAITTQTWWFWLHRIADAGQGI
jgi:hypothetical protein